MKSLSPYQLSFPCPSCQQILHLTSAQALGACPHCTAKVQALFTAVVVEADEDDKPNLKGFDARHFRPDSRPGSSQYRSHTPRPR